MMMTAFSLVALGTPTPTASAAPAPSARFAVAEPQTARDFFLNLPSEYVKVDRATREKMLSGKAAEPDHVSFTVLVEGTEDWGEVKLFKRADGVRVVAMVINGCIDGECAGQLLFLAYENGKYRDISGEIAPELDFPEIVKDLKSQPGFENLAATADSVLLTATFQGDGVTFFAGQKKAAEPGTPIRGYRWTGTGFSKINPTR